MGKEINIGIDLGTTNTVVCYSRRGRPDFLEFGNSPLLPSAVYIDESGKISVGDLALKKGVLNPQRLIKSSKTHMGDLDFVYPDSDPRLSFEKKLTPADVAELILLEVKKTLVYEEICDEDDVINAVITVPAYFGINQINQTAEAGKKAGFNVKRILSEPTAAAIAYIRKQIKNKTKLFVIDFGGGTFDLTLLEYNSANKDMYGNPIIGGDNHLGGDDVDNCLVMFLFKCFKKESGIDLSKFKQSQLDATTYMKAVASIYNHAKKAKHQLSVRNEYRVEILELVPGHNFSYTITREEMEKCCETEIFDRILDTISSMISKNNIDIESIDEVVLVGGSCYIPRVRKIVEEIFGKETKPFDLSNVVALGAYIASSEGLNLHESIAYDLGIEVLRANSFSETKFVPIISRGSSVPCSSDKDFKPSVDNQNEIKVNVYDRADKIPMSDESIDNCNFIGSIYFNDFKPGSISDKKINIMFEFNESRVLTVKITDMNTGAVKVKTLDKKRHKINQENYSTGPMDIFLLIDSSGSMRGSKLLSAKRAVKSLVNNMVDMSVCRVGVISFDIKHELVSKLTNNKEIIIDKTMKIMTGSSTYTGEAVNEAYNQFITDSKNDRKKVMIMMTDGVIFDESETESACDKMKKAGIRVVTIGVGREVNVNFLKKIASVNGNKKDMYPIETMDLLAATFRTIINSLREA